MKKAILLGVAMLCLGSEAANASGFHLNIFAPTPIYAAPAPVYAARPRPVYVETYPVYYASSYPQYNYEYNYWYYDDDREHGRRCNRHKRHRHGYHHDDRYYR